MGLRLIFLICFLWGGTFSKGFGQVLADFTFDDTSDLPASLKKNAAGKDAIGINPNALSDGEGVYVLKDPNFPGRDQNIDLKVPEDLWNHTESIYLEFDFRSQEEFAWLIFSGTVPGQNLFRFAHSDYPDPDIRQGFNLRYSTKANPSLVIESGYVGTALAKGERAIIGFWYDKDSGTAYIYKDGVEIWQTPDDQKTPGFGIHWQTADGFFTVGSHMDGEESTTPSLYRFRAAEQLCMGVFPPIVENDTICGDGGMATLRTSGGEEGKYRWYTGTADNLTLIQNETGSTYTTPFLQQTTSYWVSIASDICESNPVQVHAIVKNQPLEPQVHFDEICGEGEVILTLVEPEADTDYWWYPAGSPQKLKENTALSLTLSRDTVIYVVADNGYCKSEPQAVSIQMNDPVTLDVGEDVTIYIGERVELMAAGNFVSCTWTSQGDFEPLHTPQITVSPEITQSFIVTATGLNGCEITESVTVYVNKTFPVPNAFTPNNDGRNDTWTIPNIEKYPHCKIKVFNRWGNEVFSSEGYEEAWDGYFNGRLLPAGTYYYTLQLSPQHEAVKGSVLLFQ